MKMSTSSSTKMDTKRQRPLYCSFLSTMVLFSGAFFIWSAFFFTDHKERFSSWKLTYARQTARSNNCETPFSPDHEIKALPRGIVSKTSDLLMQPLWGPRNKKNPKRSTNLLAMAVGIKQKESVNKIVEKFLSSNFVVMLFHYDGIVNDWREFEWSDRAIHVSATSQTKWWFAKRFLHPDIVSDYAYIFLWDEDLGVEHFNVDRYLSIIKEEGLQISQPALDLNKSTEVHHPLTARDSKQRVHRKVHTVIGRRKCDENSTEPPCTGWVEMMAPVFSTASWRCAWHLIQNDLIHAWGLDFQLGYCAQGDRTKNIGIVDSEYIIHYGLPTLGASDAKKAQADSPQSDARSEVGLVFFQVKLFGRKPVPVVHCLRILIGQVRKLSFIELEIFKNRWKKAVKDDENWFDPYDKKKSQDKIS